MGVSTPHPPPSTPPILGGLRDSAPHRSCPSQDMPFLPGQKLGCDRPPTTLLHYLSTLPQRPAREPAAGKGNEHKYAAGSSSDRKHNYEEEKAMPKESEAMKEDKQEQVYKEADEDLDDEPLGSLPEAVRERLWASLAEMRAEFAAQVAGHGDDFDLVVRGARSLSRRTRLLMWLSFTPSQVAPSSSLPSTNSPSTRAGPLGT